MRVLVTGAGGFIGNNLLKKLSSEPGLIVSSIDLHDFFSDDQKWEGKLLSILEGIKPNLIFHIGACSNTLDPNVNYVMQINYQTTKNLVDWSNKNEAKMIYSSSAANYGDSGNFPSNLYGWSKYAAEGYVISNGGVALRYFNVYGPGEEHKKEMSSMIYQFYQRAKEFMDIFIFPGYPQRDFIYIKDVVSANIFAMKNYTDLKGDWYDIGTYESYTFEDVLDMMKIYYWRYNDVREIPKGYQFHTKAKKWMPGWTAEFGLEDGLKDYVKYLDGNK